MPIRQAVMTGGNLSGSGAGMTGIDFIMEWLAIERLYLLTCILPTMPPMTPPRAASTPALPPAIAEIPASYNQYQRKISDGL